MWRWSYWHRDQWEGTLGGKTAQGLDYLEQDSSLIIETDLCLFSSTRSYAALRAADLDWIVGPGYSLGRVHSVID